LPRTLTSRALLAAFAFLLLLFLPVGYQFYSLARVTAASDHLTMDVVPRASLHNVFITDMSTAVIETLLYAQTHSAFDRAAAQQALVTTQEHLDALNPLPEDAQTIAQVEAATLHRQETGLFNQVKTNVMAALTAVDGGQPAAILPTLATLGRTHDDIQQLDAATQQELTAEIADTTAAVNASLSESTLWAEMRLLTVIVLLVLSLVLMQRCIMRPLQTLAVFTGAVAGGNLNQTLAATGSCEIGDLQRAFNEMVHNQRAQRDALQNRNDALHASLAEREQADAALRESEDRFRQLFEQLPDALLLLDPHTPDGSWPIISCNTAAGQMNGYPPAALLGQSIDLLNEHPAQPGEREAYLARLRAEGLIHVETVHRTPDGRLFHVDSATSLIQLNGHELVLGIDRDITIRKQADAALRESEERFVRVFAGSPAPISIIRLADWRYVDVNPAFITLLGYTREEIIGQMASALDKGEDLPGRALFIQALLKQEPVRGLETQLRTKAGELRDMLIFVEYIELAGERCMLTISYDTTERKQIERMKNEFISTVSHELRTPLTSIRGSLGLIAGGVAGPVPPQVKAMVDIAYSNSERLVRLINDILDIEKIESGKMAFDLQPHALLPLIEQTIAANSGYAAQLGVCYALQPLPADVTVNIDPDRLIQVLTNLLSNAAKFSPAGGTVEVAVVQHEGAVRVSVRDHGPGIPAEFHGRIFQKFAQADSSDTRQKGGTGLGLSISKAIMECFGGHIGFTTTAGSGSTFYFELPEWQPALLPRLAALPTSGFRPGLPVLVCEDDRDIAVLLRLMLVQAGFQADLTASAAQAKQRLSERPYAALILDLLLPDQDGVDLLRELRAAPDTHDLPIVVVSARAEISKQELNGSALTVVDWLDKPIDHARLVGAVQRATQGWSETAHQPRILHVEDDPDIRQIVATMLGAVADLTAAATLAEARSRLAVEHFDLVILDLGLPDGTGLDLLPQLTGLGGRMVPVVLFSAREVTPDIARKVDAALVKTRTSNQQLLATVTALMPHDQPLLATSQT
jgi:PAS domain S-box-containing protein